MVYLKVVNCIECELCLNKAIMKSFIFRLYVLHKTFLICQIQYINYIPYFLDFCGFSDIRPSIRPILPEILILSSAPILMSHLRLIRLHFP